MLRENLRFADWSLVPGILKIIERNPPGSLPFYRCLEFYASCKSMLNAVLLTPGGKIDKFGTFVLYVHDFNYGTFYSLNSDYKEIKLLLLTTKLIPWERKPIWGPIHENFQPALEEIYDERNMRREKPTENDHGYLIGENEVRKITYTCPSEVYFGSLKEEQAQFIDSYWPHRDPNSDKVVKFVIERNGGLGLYLKESNELIGWCLIWDHNGPGHLFVTEKHRKKGYGKLIAKAVTKLLIETGIQPVLWIEDDNKASQELFRSIGYQKFVGIRFSSARPEE